ncbi:uncharacterized protein LOC118508274 [Anopheles stephensi]|uniref:uncharacterized protein LOC118508274 n=1 Tax=Anopheles stephensi TaxID=30069 RepID=UPI0016588A5C|nr:uncharacterized protein LOC118508274 [Anopheles stephensi]
MGANRDSFISCPSCVFRYASHVGGNDSLLSLLWSLSTRTDHGTQSYSAALTDVIREIPRELGHGTTHGKHRFEVHQLLRAQFLISKMATFVRECYYPEKLEKPLSGKMVHHCTTRCNIVACTSSHPGCCKHNLRWLACLDTDAPV